VKAVRVLARRTGCSLEAERMKEDMALAVSCGYVGEVVQARSLRSNRCDFNGKDRGDKLEI
jgi:hypothetical protein